MAPMNEIEIARTELQNAIGAVIPRHVRMSFGMWEIAPEVVAAAFDTVHETDVFVYREMLYRGMMRHGGPHD
jgi:hypothetical protein